MKEKESKKASNVPPLRFPGFTDEWKRTTLGEIVQVVKDKVSTSELQSDSYISTENILPNFAGVNENCNIPESQNVTKYIAGDILLANIRPYLKKIWLADRSGGCNADVLVFRPNNNSSFVYYSIANDKFCDYVMSGAKGVKMPRGDKEQVLKFEIGITSEKEQQKIVQLLSLINERIATHHKIIEDLKKLKSAIIDKLYSEVNGELCSYSELFTVVTERNTKRSYNKVIAASQEYGMVERESLNLNVQFDECSINTYKIINCGDYVIHLRSFQGGFAFSKLQGICSPAYIILRPNDSVEYSYFENYFTSSKFINSLRLVTYGIRDGRSINVDEWLCMKVILPSQDEQKLVIQTIQSIQNKIANETNILSELESQRKFCLHAMFI